MSNHLLAWPELTKGNLIRRYKRFMADVLLENGETVTVHCPNSGKMLTCCREGRPVYLSRSENPARKFPFTWEMIEMPDSLVVVNTLRANTTVKAALERGLIPELEGYSVIRSEFPYGKKSRIDLLLTGPDRAPCLVEIKSSTLVEKGVARFPDAVTVRGLKHLMELRDAVKNGYRCVMFFLIQRTDAHTFRPAHDIDPVYGQELKNSHECGIEIISYDTTITYSGMNLGTRIPVRL
jgi:sugar fermentation stimulation protein A